LGDGPKEVDHVGRYKIEQLFERIVYRLLLVLFTKELEFSDVTPTALDMLE